MGIRGIGNTREQAFEQAAIALTSVICDTAAIHPREAVAIQCQAPDDELLLVDWLNAIVYAMATRKLLFGRFEVQIHDRQLTATAWGEPLEMARHEPTVEIKGATYTALRVAHEPDGRWIAQCVVDV